MNRLLIVGMALLCGTVAFAAVPPTAANMKLDWDVNPVVFEKDDPTPKSVVCLLDFTTEGVDPYGVQGWALGLCVDPAKIKVDSAGLGDDTKAAFKLDPNQMPWSRVTVLREGTGITCGVVIDFNGVAKVPPSTKFKALDATFSNVALTVTSPPAAPDSTKVSNCATLGSPPVIPVVVVDGVSIPFGTAVDLVVQRAQGEVQIVETKLELVRVADCQAAVHLTTGKYAVDAVSFGVKNSANGIVTSVDRGAATADADFFGAKIVSGGATVGIVMSLDTPFTPLPASQDPAEVAKLSYGNSGPETTIKLEFSDALGTPPVDIVVTKEGGEDVPKSEVVIGGALDLACPIAIVERFVRGDANQDGQINISDGVYIARALFGVVPDLGCADAHDVNDDEILDPSDPIYLLNYLFMGGPGILPPIPADLRAIVVGDCGPDPAGTALKCPTYPICQ